MQGFQQGVPVRLRNAAVRVEYFGGVAPFQRFNQFLSIHIHDKTNGSELPADAWRPNALFMPSASALYALSSFFSAGMQAKVPANRRHGTRTPRPSSGRNGGKQDRRPPCRKRNGGMRGKGYLHRSHGILPSPNARLQEFDRHMVPGFLDCEADAQAEFIPAAVFADEGPHPQVP